MSGIKWWGIVAAMAVVGAVSGWRFFGPTQEGAAAQVAGIPHRIGQWQGTDMPVEERTYEILETRDVLYRAYRHPRERAGVDLCIVFSATNRKAPHPPEVCYTGSGAHVDRRPPEILRFAENGGVRDLQGNCLGVVRGGTRELVLYWYLAGKELTTRYYGQQAKLLWAQLLGRPTQAAMIRYSTVIHEESSEQAMERLKMFAQRSLPVILDQLT